MPNGNPFMVTSNQSYGIDLDELQELHSKRDAEIDLEEETASCTDKKHDLSFLYTRESDRIGERLKPSDSSLAKEFSNRESLSALAKEKRTSAFAKPAVDEHNVQQCRTKAPDQIEAILEEYKHAPKEENPLYHTTSNQFGQKKPSINTVTTVSYSRSQSFSSSFNRKMFRDQGLNTSSKRSQVHDFV